MTTPTPKPSRFHAEVVKVWEDLISLFHRADETLPASAEKTVLTDAVGTAAKTLAPVVEEAAKAAETAAAQDVAPAVEKAVESAL